MGGHSVHMIMTIVMLLVQLMDMVAQHQVDGGLEVVSKSTSTTTMEDQEGLYI